MTKKGSYVLLFVREIIADKPTNHKPNSLLALCFWIWGSVSPPRCSKAAVAHLFLCCHYHFPLLLWRQPPTFSPSRENCQWSGLSIDVCRPLATDNGIIHRTIQSDSVLAPVEWTITAHKQSFGAFSLPFKACWVKPCHADLIFHYHFKRVLLCWAVP